MSNATLNVRGSNWFRNLTNRPSRLHLSRSSFDERSEAPTSAPAPPRPSRPAEPLNLNFLPGPEDELQRNLRFSRSPPRPSRPAEPLNFDHLPGPDDEWEEYDAHHDIPVYAPPPVTTLSPREEFIQSIPAVPISQLAEDARCCNICQETFHTAPHYEEPVQLLPCGHFYGRHCIRRWLSISGENHNSCPMCRSVLYEEPERQQNSYQNSPERAVSRSNEDVIRELTTFVNSSTTMLEDANARAVREVERAHTQAMAMDSADLIRDATRDALVRRGRSGVRLDDMGESRSASELLTSFQRLRSSWPWVHRDELSQYERLANQIEATRQRLVPTLAEMRMRPLWCHHGPGVVTLLNPVMKPLVEEYLDSLIEAERWGMSRR